MAHKLTKKQMGEHCRKMFPDDKIADARTQKYLWNIWAVGIEYDGETTMKGLKSVIDDMVKNAKLAMKELKPISSLPLKPFRMKAFDLPKSTAKKQPVKNNCTFCRK